MASLPPMKSRWFVRSRWLSKRRSPPARKRNRLGKFLVINPSAPPRPPRRRGWQESKNKIKLILGGILLLIGLAVIAWDLGWIKV